MLYFVYKLLEMVEADAGLGLFIGISCGLCFGWVLRGRFGKTSLKNLTADKVSIMQKGLV